MTNENLALISAIKSFKEESNIFKQVINNLVNEEADENLIILLLNPDLVDKIIEPDKYTEALEYLMHTYQVERSSIVRDMMLKRYEKKVQGEITEARVSSVPTKDLIESGYRDEDDIKKAKDAADTFVNNPKKVPMSPKTHDIVNNNSANNKVKKGASEIVQSLEPGFIEAENASKDFEKKHEEVKPKVEVPRVSVTPSKKIEQPKVEPKKESNPEKKVVEPKKEEKKVKEKPIMNTPSPAARTTGELDNKMHEVKKTRSVSDFFKKHKKGILIATGLAMVAVTSAMFSPIIIPSLISANATCASLATSGAVKSLFIGLNKVLAKTIGATFMNSQWLNSAGAVITSTVAKGGLLTALGTFGLWGAYGAGFGVAIKNMFKAVDLPSAKEIEEIEKEENKEYISVVEEKKDQVAEKTTKNIPTYEELKERVEDLDLRVKEENGYSIPTFEDLRRNASSAEDIYEDSKDASESLTQEEVKSSKEESEEYEYFGPTHEELRMDAPKEETVEDIENAAESIEQKDLEPVEEVKEDDSFGPTYEELRRNAPKEEIYKDLEGDLESVEQKDLEIFKEEAKDETFSPTYEELRTDAKEKDIYVFSEEPDESERQVYETSLVEELRRNAPKEIIEIRDQEELEDTAPTAEELKENAEKQRLIEKLLEPTVVDAPSKEESLDLPDDALSAEDFEQLIKELQKSNAAKKERERLAEESYGHSVMMGL